MIKICFVCTGNTCRSVMAERIMKKKLKEIKNKDIKVSSKGINALGDNITENAKLVLKHLKVLSSNRKSVKLGKIDGNTLYITMTNKQKEMINCKNSISFVSLIGHEIEDPYGCDYDVYLGVAKEIENGIDNLLKKIKEWRNL